MIAYLRGKILACREDYLVSDVNGVGYRVFAPSSTLQHLPPKGEEIALHIYTAVREDAIILYGFKTESELDLFRLLISVTGIGPKVAIGILSALDVASFKRCIVYEDIVTLKKTPGIGEKTAKRLILELKNKVSLDVSAPVTEESLTTVHTPVIEEAVEALMALGYSRGEAFQAVEQVQEKDDLQQVIRKALKFIGQGRN